MSFCAKCGAPVEGRFCANCGAAAGEATAPPAGAAYASPAPHAVSAALNDSAASAMCYVLGFITGILFLMLEPYRSNRTVRFHAFQSIFLSGALFILWIAVRIFAGIIAALVGWVAWTIMFFFGLACLAIWVLMVVTTLQGRSPHLPVVGPLAQQQV